MPPIADGLAELALRHPGAVLILAHAGIADQGILASRLAGHPGVLYDTSCFSALDVLALFGRVPAERIVFGSDPPYGRPLTGLYLVLRAALAAGVDEATLALVLGGTVARLLAGEPLPEPTAPRAGAGVELYGRLARFYSYGLMAFGAVIATREPESALEALDLMAAVTRDPDPGPEAEAEALERLAAATAAAARLTRMPNGTFAALGLLHLSMSLAATEREAERRR
jgi:hypothetical protein